MSEEQDLQVLKNLNELSSTETPPVETEKSPISAVENALSRFVQDAMDVTREDFDFNTALKNEILKRLPNLSDNMVATMFSNTNVNLNDKISKVLGPTFQLMTSKQQAEMAKAQAEQKLNQAPTLVTGCDMRQVNAGVSTEVLQGVTSLNNLISQILKDQSKGDS